MQCCCDACLGSPRPLLGGVSGQARDATAGSDLSSNRPHTICCLFLPIQQPHAHVRSSVDAELFRLLGWVAFQACWGAFKEKYTMPQLEKHHIHVVSEQDVALNLGRPTAPYGAQHKRSCSAVARRALEALVPC